jgi:hypothetical protein
MTYKNILYKIIDTMHKIKHRGSINSCDICAKYADFASELPGAPYQNLSFAPTQLPTLSNLWSVLERNSMTERAQIESDPAPSQTALERFALKDAVLEYYKSLNIDANTQIVDGFGKDTALPPFAPNKESIYNIWCQKLYDLNRRNDKYHFDGKAYKHNIERGSPQGGAFEKQLDRYRDEFMNQIWFK